MKKRKTDLVRGEPEPESCFFHRTTLLSLYRNISLTSSAVFFFLPFPFGVRCSSLKGDWYANVRVYVCVVMVEKYSDNFKQPFQSNEK